MTWETQDVYYQSFGNDYAALARDQIVYELMDWGEDDLTLMALYDYDQYYHPYTLAGSTPDALFDPAHERLTGSYEEDGKLVLTIEYDENMAQESLEAMGLEYTGQAVMTRITVDASTYEILAYDKFTVENGEEDIFRTTMVSYDRPEPMACLTLRAAFERSYVKTINVTYVFDPGTNHEIVRTMTVPANTACDAICQSAPCVYFYDLEQTRCTGWDRMSDLTVYLYTNPDEALVQRFQELQDAKNEE